ncbi:recombination associated protein RdgC [Pasteurella langaaensis DSM 22999]|uniref:Recombination-associated protein RdgC n=1 Tax=Alitibacter langaaensis DSM 22999 TaxID=1122935 RepID=A0A2U0SL65_9PAST|nr:recombination-associated protein RdgC [Pasteurella langaaensis]PVX32081.1 recombination associated protein RdgC [Pasteurella langaaensis DSM 22999]
MWFKNVLIYKLTKELDWSGLQDQLAQHQYFPCNQSDMSKFGWTTPLRGSELLHFSVGKQILLVAHKEEKILPSHVVKAELDERIRHLEEKEARKLKKTEKQALKDDVVAMLLPRAFSKNQQTAIWINAETNLIYVDAAANKRAEDALALLRKSLGSLPVVPLAFVIEPALAMTNWIAQSNIPQYLTALEEGELKAAEDKGIIRCKNQSLESEEIFSHLEKGKLVTKLALDWDEHLSFVFCEDGSLKRLKFADQIREKNDDILKEDFAQRFDADFILMTGELTKLTAFLLDDLGGEKERL